ncbi:MAG TPA: hypothetical protein VIY47_11105, partial [Ignavibacteriaceae bacterium]
MFSKKFRFSPDREEYPSYIPLWVSLMRQEDAGRFSMIEVGDISETLNTILKAYASSIYFVALDSYRPSKDIMDCSTSYYSRGSDIYEEDERTQYASCLEMYRFLVQNESKMYKMFDEYPNLMGKKKDFAPGYYEGSYDFGDHRSALFFSIRKMFLATMYLITSSWENGTPDFEFLDVPENIRSDYKEWTKNKECHPEIERLCKQFPGTMSTDSGDLFKDLRNHLFEEFCYQRLIRD